MRSRPLPNPWPGADPCRRIDPVASHVIVASSAGSGRGQYFTLMVPADKADPEFTSWLAALGVPGMTPPRYRTPDAAQPHTRLWLTFYKRRKM